MIIVVALGAKSNPNFEYRVISVSYFLNKITFLLRLFSLYFCMLSALSQFIIHCMYTYCLREESLIYA